MKRPTFQSAKKFMNLVCSPFEVTKGGDNLYIENNVVHLMQWYAEKIVGGESFCKRSDFLPDVTRCEQSERVSRNEGEARATLRGCLARKGEPVIPRPALRYYGGKFRMSDWIISYFPKHTVYLEPCFGAGSILFNKARAKVETINDLDRNVVNFFKQLRDNSDKLIENLKNTPWARDEATTKISGDDLEKARVFWVQSWMTIAQKETNQSFRISKKGSAQPAKIMLELDYLKLVAERLRGVQIESMDALEFISRYDTEEALIYFDPPYLKATRSHADEYAVEMDVDKHVEAAKLLNSCKAKVIVSGYRHELYDELYAGWQRVEKKFLANSQQTKTESLWLSKNIDMINLWNAV